jgi:hypothetical protein
MRRNDGRRRRLALVLVAFLLLAGVLGVLVQQKISRSRQAPPAPPPVREAGTILVTLFFADPAADRLAREGREIEACGEPMACVEALVEELANGPVGDLEPTIPPATNTRAVQVLGDLAIVSLNQEFLDGLPSGSSAELTALYSLVNSIAFNLPQVKRVQFLVEGAPAPTLKGHLDLRQPLVPDYSLERPSGAEPTAAAPSPATPPSGGKGTKP